MDIDRFILSLGFCSASISYLILPWFPNALFHVHTTPWGCVETRSFYGGSQFALGLFVMLSKDRPAAVRLCVVLLCGLGIGRWIGSGIRDDVIHRAVGTVEFAVGVVVWTMCTESGRTSVGTASWMEKVGTASWMEKVGTASSKPASSVMGSTGTEGVSSDSGEARCVPSLTSLSVSNAESHASSSTSQTGRRPNKCVTVQQESTQSRGFRWVVAMGYAVMAVARLVYPVEIAKELGLTPMDAQGVVELRIMYFMMFFSCALIITTAKPESGLLLMALDSTCTSICRAVGILQMLVFDSEVERTTKMDNIDGFLILSQFFIGALALKFWTDYPPPEYDADRIKKKNM